MRSPIWYAFLLLISSVLSVSAAYANVETSCEHYLPSAVGNFVAKEFPGSLVWHEIKAYNDVLCGAIHADKDDAEAENMANVVITVYVSDGRSLYGIFHLHWKEGGVVKNSPASFFESERWRALPREDDWKPSWCELINFVYSHERREQGCR